MMKNLLYHCVRMWQVLANPVTNTCSLLCIIMCSQVLISTVITATFYLYLDSKVPCGVCLKCLGYEHACSKHAHNGRKQPDEWCLFHPK